MSIRIFIHCIHDRLMSYLMLLSAQKSSSANYLFAIDAISVPSLEKRVIQLSSRLPCIIVWNSEQTLTHEPVCGLPTVTHIQHRQHAAGYLLPNKVQMDLKLEAGLSMCSSVVIIYMDLSTWTYPRSGQPCWTKCPHFPSAICMYWRN